jgi:hypothetical protein
MARPEVRDPDLKATQPQRHRLLEDQGRPRQTENRFHAGEQAREPLDLGLHVLLAALGNQVVGSLAGDDLLAPVCEKG